MLFSPYFGPACTTGSVPVVPVVPALPLHEADIHVPMHHHHKKIETTHERVCQNITEHKASFLFLQNTISVSTKASSSSAAKTTKKTTQGIKTRVLLLSVKTGWKGDPRMHRAVAARLKNPNISLFDALLRGGFEYTHDDDCNHVDSENVTIGQRKNQLRRRVRLARQQESHKEKRSSQSKRTIVQHKSKGRKIKQSLVDRKDSADKGGTDASESKKSYLSDEEDCDNQEGSTKSDESSTKERKELLAKFHPQYRPILFPPLVSGQVGKESDTNAPVLGTTSNTVKGSGGGGRKWASI